MEKKKVKKFEALRVWQESIALAVELYHHLKDCKDFGLKDQMQKSVISISSSPKGMIGRPIGNSYSFSI